MEKELRALAAYLNDTFSDIVFDESKHTYRANGDYYTSVTKYIKRFIDEPDFEMIAGFIDRKHNLKSGTTKRLWELKGRHATALGRRVHFFAEVYTWHRTVPPDSGYERAVSKFLNSLPKHIVPLLTEFIVYSDNLKIAGTIDLVLFDLNKKMLILADYKTNEDLSKNFKEKKLLPPFTDFYDSPLGKYILQLNLYDILISAAQIPVSERWIVHVKDNGKYNVILVPDYTERVQKAIENENT